jgi:hypothetical protein
MSPLPDGGGANGSPYLERQRALLYNMLRVTREQRRCLIDGDLKGIEEANHLLGTLLSCQEKLHHEGPAATEPADHLILEEIRQLAADLQRESRANYLLACRGAQLTNFSLSLLTGADDDQAPPSDYEPAPTPAPANLMDRPA